MRSPNPFSPGFSAPPAVFVGRESYLKRIRASLTDSLDPNRCFFVEGTRGSGKTVLLHQIAALTQSLKWVSCTANSIHASAELYDMLVERFGVKQRFRASLKPSITLPGNVGASVGELTAESLPAHPSPLLSNTVLKALRKRGRWKGLFLGVDEAQRIGEQDAAEICAAFQEARSQGLPMVLVITGLPGTHERIASFPHCTFTRRAPRMVLEPFDVAETMEALSSLFAKVPEIRLSQDQLYELGHFTQGHPYLVQLVGYHLYQAISEHQGDALDAPSATAQPAAEEISLAEALAYEHYRKNVLKPVIDPLGEKTRAYLEALINTMDDEGIMTNGSTVAHALGKESTRATSAFRQSLIAKCILEDLGRGKLGFIIPYIPRYLHEQELDRAFVPNRKGKWKREI